MDFFSIVPLFSSELHKTSKCYLASNQRDQLSRQILAGGCLGFTTQRSFPASRQSFIRTHCAATHSPRGGESAVALWEYPNCSLYNTTTKRAQYPNWLQGITQFNGLDGLTRYCRKEQSLTKYVNKQIWLVCRQGLLVRLFGNPFLYGILQLLSLIGSMSATSVKYPPRQWSADYVPCHHHTGRKAENRAKAMPAKVFT